MHHINVIYGFDHERVMFDFIESKREAESSSDYWGKFFLIYIYRIIEFYFIMLSNLV